jgi:hypothetical protein
MSRWTSRFLLLLVGLLLLLPVLPPPPAFATGDPDEVVERYPIPPYFPSPPVPPPGNGQRGVGGEEPGDATDESEWSELELLFDLFWSVFERTP